MNQLIKIENVNGTESVSAKELYDFLELDKSHYSRWVQKNIVGEPFFTEGVDYQGFAIVANGNETMEYAISIDMAKELSMLARNQKGKEARQYFIEVEKQSKNLNIPQTYAEALRLCADQVEQIEAQKQALQIAEPKVEQFDKLMKTESMMSISNACKHFGIKPIKHGIPSLKYHGYMTTKNLPTQRAIDIGIMKLRETVGTDKRAHMQAVVETCQLEKFGKILERITKEIER